MLLICRGKVLLLLTQLSTHTDTYTHAHTRTHMHTYTHAHTLTHMPSPVEVWDILMILSIFLSIFSCILSKLLVIDGELGYLINKVAGYNHFMKTAFDICLVFVIWLFEKL